MSIGSTQLPEPATPPEIHDIGIVSVSDDQETVNAAVGLEPEKPPKDTPGAETTPPADAAGEETPPVETPAATVAGEETPPPETPPAEKTGVQKRIDTLSATVANRDQHIQALTQRLDAMERRQAQPPPVEKPAAPAEPAKFAFPSFEVYGETHADATYEQYIDERTDAKFEHRQETADAQRKADDTQQAQTAQQQQAQAVLDQNTTRMDEFTAQHPTFTATLQASKSPMTPVMEETMMRSQIGPALAMFVAENPEEATRISQIPDAFAQAIEVVRLEAHPDVVALAEKVWSNGAPAAADAPRSGAEQPSASAGARNPPSTHVAPLLLPRCNRRGDRPATPANSPT